MHRVEMETVVGKYAYDECFGCGYSTDEWYEEGYDFRDPDEKWNDRSINKKKTNR